MEFKHSVIRSSAYQPPPSSADQAMQGPNLRNMYVHDAIQIEKTTIRHEIIAFRREIEKEKICQEIIAAETGRRRELVAEVMREMAVEREMAMAMLIDRRLNSVPSFGNFWLEQQLASANPSRTGFPSNMSQPLPVAARTQAKPDKYKLIVLDKPDPESFREKGKAVAPPAAGAEKLRLLGLKTKPKEEWSCALCQVSATNEKGFNEHLQGKKHKAKEADLREEIKAKKASSSKWRRKVCSKLTESKEVDRAKKVGKTPEGKMKFSFWCRICNVGTFSKTVMENHMLGSKHKARLREQCATSEDGPTTKPISNGFDTPTGTTTETEVSAVANLSSDDIEELKTMDAAPEEVKIENSVSEGVKGEDPPAEDARGENPMVEEVREDEQVVEEARGEDKTTGKATAQDPMAEEARTDDPTVEEKRIEDVVVEEVKEEGVLLKETKTDEAREKTTLESKNTLDSRCEIM